MKDSERKLLADALITRSQELERYGSGRRQDFQAGIELLKTLEPIARQTMTAEIAASAAATAAAAAAGAAAAGENSSGGSGFSPAPQQSQAASASAPSAFSSNQAGYRPALKDPGIVDALLDFHKKTALPPKGRSPDLQARLDRGLAPNATRTPGLASQNPPQSTPSTRQARPPTPAPRGFQASAAPRVAATPKPQSQAVKNQRMPGNRIFRSDGS